MCNAMIGEHLKIAHAKKTGVANLNRIPKITWKLNEELIES